MVLRPTCSGWVVPWAEPARTPRKKLVLDSMVDGARSFGKVEEGARRAQAVGQRHDDAAVHHIVGCASLGGPGD